jgi:hypothetical protein
VRGTDSHPGSQKANAEDVFSVAPLLVAALAGR